MPRSTRKRKSNSDYVKLVTKIKKLTELVERKCKSETDSDSDDSEETNSVASTNSSRCFTPTDLPLDQNITMPSPVTSSVPHLSQHATTNTVQIENILGDFKRPPNRGQSLHSGIQQRWEKFLKEGVDKDEILNFRSLYPQPKNLNTLYGPDLNLEIKTAIPQSTLKSDTYIQKIQHEIGIALCAISEPLNKRLLNENDHPTSEIKVLADTAKILCNVHNKLSLHRRYGIIQKLDLSIKDGARKRRG
ncbi:uncharacterized protein LOC115887895 [Sitophilus oryzae]|uniref:Uncharacterized protein LOC115887895 n=1 Tax=Sitophilus oryzae TaxID=7048 RepID=A0A6J2YIQ8_SITOR|nr:uncharacterized protein LOC115887895 [Sitophilus oryzae]